MSTFKKYERKNEGAAFVKDVFREGDSIWVKKVKVDGYSVIQFVGSLTGMQGTHTAIVSVHVKSMRFEGGEDMPKHQRYIVHTKIFSKKEAAIDHLLKIKDEIEWA